MTENLTLLNFHVPGLNAQVILFNLTVSRMGALDIFFSLTKNVWLKRADFFGLFSSVPVA